jgi:UDP-glucose 4-epimerase
MDHLAASRSERPKRCLVLGGRGFIGSHLVDALLSRGYIVRCFDRPNVQLLSQSHLSNDRFELCEGDIVSEADVGAALGDCDACFHLVSTTLPKSSNADPIFDVESNVLGTLRLLAQAVQSGLRKLVFVSSGGTVYGKPRQIPILEEHATNPVCSYGITKLSIEKYLHLFLELHGLEYTVLRLANPFGEGQRIHASQGAIAVFIGKILRGEPIEIWGDGSVVRDYIYIKDVVDALLAALDRTTEERVFNIGSGYGRSLNEVIDSIETATGCYADRRYMPARQFDVPANVLGISRAKELLDWSPKVSFETGLEGFANWVRSQQ